MFFNTSHSYLWALVVIAASLNVSLAAPAPAQEETPLTTVFWSYNVILDADVSDGVTGANTFTLPPVSDVFKSMALADSESSLSALSLPATATTSILSGALATELTNPHSLISTTTVHGSESNPVATPTATSVDPSQENSEGEPHPFPTPMRKLIVIGSVIGGIAAITLCLVLVTEIRSWRKKRSIASTVEGETKKIGDVRHPMAPWLTFTPPPSNRGTENPDISEKIAASETGARAPDKVMDITSEFPRSKFSVTSSDYPFSVESTSSSLESIDVLDIPGPTPLTDVTPPPLLSPSEFFTLPSASSIQNVRRSRMQSVPVFGRLIGNRNSGSQGRSEDHRRSKSASDSLGTEPSEWDHTY